MLYVCIVLEEIITIFSISFTLQFIISLFTIVDCVSNKIIIFTSWYLHQASGSNDDRTVSLIHVAGQSAVGRVVRIGSTMQSGWSFTLAHL